MSSQEVNPSLPPRSRNKMFDYRKAIPSAPRAQPDQPPGEPNIQSKTPNEDPTQTVQPHSKPADHTPQHKPAQNPPKRKRIPPRAPHHPNIYDACAALIGSEGHLTSTHPTPLSPQEILHQRQSIRRQFPDFQTFERAYLDAQASPLMAGRLPDSDLLVAIHGYSRGFYVSAFAGSDEMQTRNDWNSMDGSALLALGILMEETCRSYVQGSGSFPFLEGNGKRKFEGSAADENTHDDSAGYSRQVSRSEYFYLDGVKVRD